MAVRQPNDKITVGTYFVANQRRMLKGLILRATI